MSCTSSAVGGLQRAQSSLEQVAGRLAKATSTQSGQAEDRVDLSTEMVNLLQARNDFQTNVNVIKTDDQMQKSTLNLLG